MSNIVVLPSAPVIEKSGNIINLDNKFVEGMRLHCRNWPGKIYCILRSGASNIPFSTDFDKLDLEFDVIIIETDMPIRKNSLSKYDIAFCAGDMHHNLNLDFDEENKTKVVYSIEYTIGTRIQIAILDNSRSLPRRLYSVLWNLLQESKRRRAFRRAHGLQANGYPAYRAYRRLNPNTILYLDNRMTPELFASEAEMEARHAHLVGGGPLRLVNSGRLEPMKGAQDLIPVARILQRSGMAFSLDIYGTGSLKTRIAEDIRSHGLERRVFLHEPVDFETELTPAFRKGADIFLSCHRQADPSCTYIESMGCGLAVLGYDNRMWAALLEQSQAGWSVPLGNAAALAEKIIEIDKRRGEIVERCRNARSFALAHDFRTEFKKRIDHLKMLTTGDAAGPGNEAAPAGPAISAS